MNMRSSGGCIRYFMADSCSQHDREFESVWTMCIEKASVVTALKVSNDLINLSKSIDDDGTQTEWERDCAIIAELDEFIWDELPAPPVGLASGRGALGDKFAATLHSSFLLGGGTGAETYAQGLADFASEHVVATGDMDVEFRLPTVKPIDVQAVFP